MLSNLKELYKLLTEDQRKKLLRLQILVILMSLLEVAGVMAIGPFMALVGDLEQVHGDGALAYLYQLSGLPRPPDFLLVVGILAMVILTLAAVVSTVTVWRLSVYGNQVGAELSSRLFAYYMRQPWLFHATNNSSALTNRIARECERVTGGIINPVMQMNAKLVMAIFMAVAIFIYNPVVAFTGLLVFSGAYWVLYNTVRRNLSRSGVNLSVAEERRFRLMNEGFGGIKDILLLNRQAHTVDNFRNASEQSAKAAARIQVLSQVPRYLMELIAFGTVVFLVLFLVASHRGDLSAILPILAIYAMAGFKLLPAFQQIYGSISSIRGNLSAFDNLRADLRASMDTRPGHGLEADTPPLVPRERILLRDIQFTYPGADKPALKGLTLEIPARQVIGLVGSSGSGKSTTIDVLLGLIRPDSGEVLIDDTPLTDTNRHQWQSSLGFVAQQLFLADASIRRNIALGLPDELIDDDKVETAARLAHLDEFVSQLPKGLDSVVGERGVQLSGGQRQRIGVARALYHDAEVLVFDEATSALDGITERLIMDAILDFSGKKTIVLIAHRLTTTKNCDRIYLMSEGKAIDSGSYSELIEKNSIFRQMADMGSL